MGCRSKRSERCQRCRMLEHLCICSSIPRYDLATRLVLVMHRREFKKVTATGPLALEVLTNSELRIHGHQDRLLDLSDLYVADRRTILLYPGDDVPILDHEFLARDERPLTLVVPDGNWRQAAKMGKRLPGLQHAEIVRLPPGSPSRWGVRREPHPEGLATFEAISRAIGIIESTEVQSGMEALFHLMVQRTFDARGYRTE